MKKLIKKIITYLKTKELVIKDIKYYNGIPIRINKKIYTDFIDNFDSVKTMIILSDLSFKYVLIDDCLVMYIYKNIAFKKLIIFFKLKDNVIVEIYVLKYNNLTTEESDFSVVNSNYIEDIIKSVKTIAKHL